MINLGDEVTDVVSNFQGIALVRHTYLGGCDRITVQPPVDKDGKLPEPATFDEVQLKVIESGKYQKVLEEKGSKKKVKKEKSLPGGAHHYPPRERVEG